MCLQAIIELKNMKSFIIYCIILIFASCDMNRSKYEPEKYFSRGEELFMAEVIYYGNKKEAKRMVETGKVDINKPGRYGFTYLMYAIYIQKYDMAKLLLELGADPNLISYVNHPIKGNNPDFIKRNKYVDELAPLAFVCGHPDWDIKYMKLLIGYGADVNMPNPLSPIHELIVGGASDMDRIKYLMKHDLDLNAPDNSGYTPVITAVIVRELDLVEYFLDNGANPNYVNKNGVSLGYELQQQIERNLGTPEYIAHAKAIIERLKKMGITFPAVQENKFEDSDCTISDDNSISTKDCR